MPFNTMDTSNKEQMYMEKESINPHGDITFCLVCAGTVQLSSMWDASGMRAGHVCDTCERYLGAELYHTKNNTTGQVTTTFKLMYL